MTWGIDDYLDLTMDQAVAQWRLVLARQPSGVRQQTYLPIEVLLCFSLFFQVNPRSFGGANMHRAPAIVHSLAALTCRSPSSIVSKMLNLDGSRTNAGQFEWRVFMALSGAPDQHAALYATVLGAARVVGIGPERLPNFLGGLAGESFVLIGQDEIDSNGLSSILDREVPALQPRLAASELETSRLVEYRARVGQHRFAGKVLENCGFRCVFCGFDGEHLGGHRLLVASHIKPWSKSDDLERLDYRNGVAACPTHDAAFDTGLLGIGLGLEVERSPKLQQVAARRESVGRFFSPPTLLARAAFPAASATPKLDYLRYHQSAVFQRGP